MIRTLRIGTRGSALALVQANWVAARLAEHGVPTEITIIRTEGDDRPVDTAWGEGAFVGRIVAALLDERVDLAVHSAKDVPTDEHPDLVIAAYPPREDARDALVCRVRGTTLATLPQGARVGTDSPRRAAFLLAERPDLQLHPLHGNVDTRLAKLDRGDSDALVLAVAGLTRLGRADRIDEILPADLVAWAPGQGSLALQVRSTDGEAIAAVGLLDDEPTRVAVEAERALLNGTGGGCRSPIGAVGRVVGGRLQLTAGAGRTWVGEAAPGCAIRAATVGWVRGSADASERRVLADRLAARIVLLRQRPRVLVGRPEGRAGSLAGAMDEAGINVVHVPAIEIVPSPAGGDLDRALAGAEPGTLIAVTSGSAAGAVLEALARIGRDPGMFRWAAVGDATASVLRDGGIDDVLVPAEANAAALAADLQLDPGDHVLLPRADIADPILPAALRDRGVRVTEAVAYATREAPESSRALLAAALDDGPVDALVLASGSTARGLAALAAAADRARLLATPVIASGATTAEASRAAGYTTVLTAPTPDAASLAAFTAFSLGLTGAGSPRPRAGEAPSPDASPSPAPSGGA
jgi:hydroxymethylbilane synthase